MKQDIIMELKKGGEFKVMTPNRKQGKHNSIDQKEAVINIKRINQQHAP